MSYEVLARKWRPQQFAEVVGQGHVTQTLSNAITSQRIAHAYLFVGPRGVGKTSIARIMAKALNCAKGPTPTPCDVCDACREITNGSNLDVMEIDGASNNSVDQVRDLRDNVKYAPARGPYKIYIIDEVHMLSIAAFNALLKTLEEPPAHIKFIFATTEPQKVPATILSRCQRFDLRRIATRDIVGHLAKIAKAEGVTIDDDALLAIARGAEGGLRDAESALDQLIAFRGKTIAEEDVLSVFGLVSRRALEDVAGAVLAADMPALLNRIADLDAAGKDLSRLAMEMLEYFRHLLVLAYAGGLPGDQDVPEAQLVSMKEQAKGRAPAALLRVVDQLMEAQTAMRYSLSRRTVLEVSLIRAARAASVVPLEEVLQHVQQLQARWGSASGGATGTSSAATVARETASRPTPAPAAPERSAPAQRAAATAPVDKLPQLVANWLRVSEKAVALTIKLGSVMRDTKPVALRGETVVIGIDPEFAANLETLKEPRSVKALQNALQTELGFTPGIEFTILPESAVGKLPADQPATPPPQRGGAEQEAAAPRPSKSKRDWEQQAAVQKTLEAFNGGIVDIRE